MHITSPIRTKDTVNTLARLWEASVRRSHHFLTEADIRQLTPFVKYGLAHIERLFVAYVQNEPAGFICLEKNKIEMLFVAPDFWGMGIGKELVLMAFRNFNIRYVDVNEQNPQAEGFYRHLGFRTFERTETDGQGNPFPILKMERERFSLRHATPEDIPVLKTLFTDTVLRTNRKDYTQEEVEDWAACADKPGHWKELIATHHFTLAEEYPGHTVGFAAVRPDGYLHSMFVHHDFQRQGIASLLLEDMEKYARLQGVSYITSEVSLTARPFFESKGYTIVEKQQRKAMLRLLTNFKMKKPIV